MGFATANGSLAAYNGAKNGNAHDQNILAEPSPPRGMERR